MKDDFERAADATYEDEHTSRRHIIREKAKETDDLVLLIEQHKKDIWEWKQKESQWVRDKNQLEGHKRIVEELSTKVVELTKNLTEVKHDNKKLAEQIEHLNKQRKF